MRNDKCVLQEGKRQGLCKVLSVCFYVKLGYIAKVSSKVGRLDNDLNRQATTKLRNEKLMQQVWSQVCRCWYISAADV